MENVRSCCVDRHCTCIGCGIGLFLAYVELESFKFIVRHNCVIPFLIQIVIVVLSEQRLFEQEQHIRPQRKLPRTNDWK